MSIGVIIPVYNNEKFIKQCIKSVLNQSYNDINIYVVDDGSKDNSKNIIKNLEEKNKNIKYIYQENSGVSAARNNGLDHSNDDYICFLDSDDFLNKDYSIKMLEKAKKENSDIVSCGTKVVSGKNISQLETAFSEKNFLYNYLIGRNKGQIASFLIKKSLIEENKLRFELGRNWSEDTDFLVKAFSKANKICILEEYLTNYRVFHKDSNLSSFNINQIEKDLSSSIGLLNDKSIELNDLEIRAIKEYRIPSTIVFRLVTAFKKGIEKNEIEKLYEKYKEYIDQFKLRHGKRSVLLLVQIIKLKYLLRFK